MKNIFNTLLLFAMLTWGSQLWAQDHPNEAEHQDEQHVLHDEHGKHGVGEHQQDDEHEEAAELIFTPQQMQATGIVVTDLKAQTLAAQISAPGEVRLNAYQSAHVGPRIQAQIVERHARLGDWLEAGTPLVTVSSIIVSEGQGAFLVADREWRRVRKLGRKTVSERRYLEAQMARQQAQARLLAYGLSTSQIKGLAAGKQVADGRFQLTAPLAGRVMSDAFVVGEIVEPGRVLFEISNEKELWVEVRLQVEQAHDVHAGAQAQVEVGQHWLPAKVIQVRHRLDEVTRTLGVRLSLANPDDRIHPGEFVQARIITGHADKAETVVPENAVLRSPDGDWQVFIEAAPGQFTPHEVEVVRQWMGQTVIEGLPVGSRVVTAGAFFVQSEQAKSGFAVHNH